MNLTREEVAETVEATIEIGAQVIVEAVMAIEEEMTVAAEITEATEMTVEAEITEATETTVAEEITEETAIEAVEAEPQIVTEAEALMIEEVVQTDQEIAAQATVEVETDTVQEALEALIEEEAVKAVVDLDKSAEGGDYRGKSGGARQSRDRDSDRGGQTAKSPWQKNKPTFEKKPAKTFRKAKGKKGGHAHNLGPKEIKPKKYEKRE